MTKMSLIGTSRMVGKRSMNRYKKYRKIQKMKYNKLNKVGMMPDGIDAWIREKSRSMVMYYEAAKRSMTVRERPRSPIDVRWFHQHMDEMEIIRS